MEVSAIWSVHYKSFHCIYVYIYIYTRSLLHKQKAIVLNKNGLERKHAYGDLLHVSVHSWSTHWFKCDMTVPKEWVGHQVRFRWDSHCEAMVSAIAKM